MTHNAFAETQIRARRAELSARVADIDHVLQAPLSADFAEQAGDLEGQESLEAMENAARREMQAIDAALKRIAAGTYGVCISCGQLIPEKRLAAVPTAMRCVSCESQGAAL
jgi:RNA polymerase-binding transcription factor DksA